MSSPKEKKIYIKDEPVSIVRKNAKKIEKSRNDWKEKNQEKANSIKALKTRVLEAKASRDNWKVDYLKRSEEIKVLQEKIQELEKDLFVERLQKDSLQCVIVELKKKLSKSIK
jgi:hypothetical protein